MKGWDRKGRENERRGKAKMGRNRKMENEQRICYTPTPKIPTVNLTPKCVWYLLKSWKLLLIITAALCSSLYATTTQFTNDTAGVILERKDS